jgi:hypothetical protein
MDGPAHRPATGGGAGPALTLTAHSWSRRARPCATRTLGAYRYRRCVTERCRTSLTRPTSGLEKAGRDASQDIRKMRYFVAPSWASGRLRPQQRPPPPGVGATSPNVETLANPSFDPFDCRPSTRPAVPTIAPWSRGASGPFGRRRPRTRVRITCEQHRPRPCRLASKMHFLIIYFG